MEKFTIRDLLAFVFVTCVVLVAFRPLLTNSEFVFGFWANWKAVMTWSVPPVELHGGGTVVSKSVGGFFGFGFGVVTWMVVAICTFEAASAIRGK